MFHFDVPVELTITKGKSFFDKSQLDKVILQTGFTSQIIASHKKWALGLFACALWPKGLMCSWDIKGLFHHTNQSRQAYKKPAQISVHKCVQNLLKNQPG